MKRVLQIFMMFLLVTGLTACTAGSEARSADERSSAKEEEKEPEEKPAEEEPQEKVLVVYFSATGTTKDIAEKIAKIEAADLYEIKAAQEYSEADLNWHDSSSRTTLEQNDASVRPEIGSEAVSLEGYTRIYIGYPIWWGEEPRIMDTFAEAYDFSGITMIPFCTSSSSGLGRSGKNLEERAGSGSWLEGKRFSAGTAEDDIRAWIESIQ